MISLIHIIGAGGIVQSKSLPAGGRISRRWVQPFLAPDEPERVHVIFNDKPTLMLVGENSARRGMAPNARASLIYWTATCKGITGAKFDPLQGPMIYGTAILLEDYDFDKLGWLEDAVKEASIRKGNFITDPEWKSLLEDKDEEF